MVPTQDAMGNRLVPLADFAHQYITGAVRGSRAWVERGKAHPPETYDHLRIVAPDTPESDSHIKQLGAHVAEMANVWGTTVLKDGKNGPQPWDISNTAVRPGEPAEQLALQPSVQYGQGTSSSISPLHSSQS